MEKEKLSKLFAFYLNNGIIDLDSLAENSKEESMNNILGKVHKYKIYVHSDGRYVTYVPDPTKKDGRRQIRKKTIDELNEFLLEFYTTEVKAKEKTFDELYKEWVDYKKSFCAVKNVHKGISPSTIRRYQRDFDNYLKDSKLSGMPISAVTAVKLETILGDIVESNNMIESCASNVVGYIRQTFAYARRSGLLKENPCEYMDRKLVLSKCSLKPKKDDSDRVLTIAEMNSLRQSVREHEKKYPDYMPNYAIELAMMTGMRVGEIAALRWMSIDDGYIHIDESEHRLDYEDKPSELIIGEPKNQKHRMVPLTDDMRNLFLRIRSLGHEHPEGFVFVRETGERCTGHDIGCAIDRRASEAMIKKTSIHGIRRTVSSILRTKLPARTVANMLGHLESTNERHYNYDFYEDGAKIEALSSISQMSSNVLNFSQNKKIAEAR